MATPRDDDNEIRIVLLGKTGAGKSSLGNNLLGEQKFKSKAGASSTTTRCETGCRVLEHGKKMIIVDTPGLYGNTQSSDEFCRCISLSDPGVHAFILVLQIGRFTEEELDTIKQLQKLFGENVTKYAFVVFTDKAQLDANDQTFDEYIAESPENLKLMLSQCGGRFMAIDNLAKRKYLQVYMVGVMDLIYKTIKENSGGFYKEEMLAVAAERVQRGTEGTWNQLTPHQQPFGSLLGRENKEYREMPGRPMKQQKAGEEREDAALIRLMELPDESAKEISIVLLGRIAAGKSSLGNNLLEERKFITKVSALSVTTECQKGSVILPDGETLTIVDTPGMYDIGRNEGKSADECCRCIGVSAPKVHVFILVLRIEVFTAEELQTIKELQTLFGEKVSKHACIVFTHKACLDADGVTLQQFIQESPQELQIMLHQCGSRYVAIDNLATGKDLQADMKSVRNLIYKTMAENKEEMFSASEKVQPRKKGKCQITHNQHHDGSPIGQTASPPKHYIYEEVREVIEYTSETGKHTTKSRTYIKRERQPKFMCCIV